MMARADIALATAVGTIGGVGIVQQDPAGMLSAVPEWLMPTAMIMVGMLYGWNMWLAHKRAESAPPPITQADLVELRSEIAKQNKESLELVASAVRELSHDLKPLLQGIQTTVSELKGALG